MREIKFRAWDCIQEKSLPVEKINFRNQYISLDEGDNSITDTFEMFQLMQYTGLKDKNGKEIYEGDIVTCSNGMAYQYKVIFSFGCFEGYDKASGFTKKLCDMKDLKVIGNTYENPELLA